MEDPPQPHRHQAWWLRCSTCCRIFPTFRPVNMPQIIIVLNANSCVVGGICHFRYTSIVIKTICPVLLIIHPFLCNSIACADSFTAHQLRCCELHISLHPYLYKLAFLILHRSSGSWYSFPYPIAIKLLTDDDSRNLFCRLPGLRNVSPWWSDHLPYGHHHHRWRRTAGTHQICHNTLNRQYSYCPIQYSLHFLSLRICPNPTWWVLRRYLLHHSPAVPAQPLKAFVLQAFSAATIKDIYCIGYRYPCRNQWKRISGRLPLALLHVLNIDTDILNFSIGMETL